jgi:hypothetical protein
MGEIAIRQSQVALFVANDESIGVGLFAACPHCEDDVVTYFFLAIDWKLHRHWTELPPFRVIREILGIVIQFGGVSRARLGFWTASATSAAKYGNIEYFSAVRRQKRPNGRTFDLGRTRRKIAPPTLRHQTAFVVGTI